MAVKLRKVRFLSGGSKLAMLAEDEEGNVTLYEDVELLDFELRCPPGQGVEIERQSMLASRVKPLREP